MTGVHLVVPEGIDDPARVSGGNRYDRELRDGLRSAGRTVGEICVPGAWPHPGNAALELLARSLDGLPDGALVLADGLVASAAGTVLVPRSRRLRVVVLVHMVFGGNAVPGDDERAVLGAARAVITTSAWTRARLLDRYRLPPARVHVAHPGAAPAPVTPPTAAGGRLLCVGALTPLKGQDLLLAALAGLGDLHWRCRVVGPLDRDPCFAAALARRSATTGDADRIRMPGTRTGADLRGEYGGADLLVVPSRTETYGMVVTEALAAGLPVVAAAVGGLPEALGSTDRGVPGLLVPPDDVPALADALRTWLTDGDRRRALRSAALRRRECLPDWPGTVSRVDAVLAGVRAEPDPPDLRGGQ